MKYKCIKTFDVEKYDEDGFSLNKPFIVKQGTIWEVDESGFRLVGDKESIRLESDYGWLEIDKDILDTYFSKIESEE